MNNAPSEILRALLINLGVAHDFQTDSSASWPVFAGFLPNKPDNAVCLYDTAGMQDGRIQRSGEQIVHPGVQIRVRSVNYRDGWKQSRAVLDALTQQVARSEVEVDSNAYVVAAITQTGDVFALGRIEEDNNRNHFSANVIVTINQKE